MYRKHYRRIILVKCDTATATAFGQFLFISRSHEMSLNILNESRVLYCKLPFYSTQVKVLVKVNDSKEIFRSRKDYHTMSYNAELCNF